MLGGQNKMPVQDSTGASCAPNPLILKPLTG
jgi:hypothetical protein